MQAPTPFPFYGNSSYNIDSVLKQNILNSDYFRNDCMKLLTWSDVVDAIYDQVEYIEPWMGGNMRGPSTAFCLLYRLCQLKPTEEDIYATITHADSVYIRAVGFLFLRYVCDPKRLWDWMGPFVQDEEKLNPSGPSEAAVTVGEFVRDLLLEQYYFETIFPRVPKKPQDDIIAELGKLGLPTKGKGNAGMGGPDRRGAEDNSIRRPASVKASLSVAFGQRAPNRANVREDGARRGEERVGGGGGGRGNERRTGSRTPPRHGDGRDARDRSRSPARREERRDERDRRRDNDERDRRRDYDDRQRNRRDDDERDRRRDYDDRDRRREYDDRRGFGRPQGDRYGGERSRGGDRRYDGRDRGGSSRRTSRSRSRERMRNGDGGRGASDVFRESAAAKGAAGDELKGRYGDASGGELFEREGGPRGEPGEEVYRIGGRYGGGGSSRR